MGKINNSKTKDINYKRTEALDTLIQTIGHHEAALNIQTLNSVDSADNLQELKEKTEKNRESAIELAKNANLLRERIFKKNYLLYAFGILSVILLIVLIILSIFHLLNPNYFIKSNKTYSSASLTSNLNYINERKKDSAEYEYDYCTDYPLDNSQRAFYYFLSVLFTILSIILFIGSICASKKYSDSLAILISENFQHNYDLCCQELKLVRVIKSILE